VEMLETRGPSGLRDACVASLELAVWDGRGGQWFVAQRSCIDVLLSKRSEGTGSTYWRPKYSWRRQVSPTIARPALRCIDIRGLVLSIQWALKGFFE
jgi:hypothetical protein